MIEWNEIISSARQHVSGNGDAFARRMIAEILGEDFLVQAVDDYVNGKRIEVQPIRIFLKNIQAKECIERCKEYYYSEKTSHDQKFYALDLLAVLADESIIPWFPEVLNNPNVEIQGRGEMVVRYLYWTVSYEKIRHLVDMMSHHENPGLQEAAKEIRLLVINEEKKLHEDYLKYKETQEDGQ